MSWLYFHERGYGAGALGDAVFATRLERASHRKGMEWRHSSFDGLQRTRSVSL
jgi:hypothetical protein